MMRNLVCAMMVGTAALTGALAAGCAQQGGGTARGGNGSAEAWSSRGADLSSPDEPSALAPAAVPIPNYIAPPQLRDRAVKVLMKASESSNALLRQQAIESLQPLPDRIELVARRGLVDDNRAVRFTAAMTIGQLRLGSLALLVEPLLNDEAASVRAAAIYALRRCGRTIDLNPLAKMIVDPDPEVRGNAAMVLGELGDKSAAKVIRGAVGQTYHRTTPLRVKIVELQMAAAMVKLGNDEDLEVIRAALFSPVEHAEITALACMLCGEVRDAAAVPNLHNLAVRNDQFGQPPEVRMAATCALAQLDPARASLEIPMSYVKFEQFEIRQMAALTLGRLGNPAALPVLEGMMSDGNPLVQVAAAGAVVRIMANSPVRGLAHRSEG